MAEPAKDEISARHEQLYEAFDQEDYDKAMTFYTSDVIALPHKEEAMEGLEAIKKSLQKMVPLTKKLVIQEMVYFELLNDSAAFTHCNLASVEEDTGKPRALFRDCLLWKKIDGLWCIHRAMFNERPMAAP